MKIGNHLIYGNLYSSSIDDINQNMENHFLMFWSWTNRLPFKSYSTDGSLNYIFYSNDFVPSELPPPWQTWPWPHLPPGETKSVSPISMERRGEKERERGPGSPETEPLACLPCSGGGISVSLTPYLTSPHFISHQEVSNLVSLLELNILSILFPKTKYRFYKNRRSRISHNQ